MPARSRFFNSNLSGNTIYRPGANSYGGGGLFNVGPGIATLINSTISGNGGGYRGAAASTTAAT